MSEMAIHELKSKAEVTLVERHSLHAIEGSSLYKEALKLKEGLEMAQDISRDLKKAMETILPENT